MTQTGEAVQALLARHGFRLTIEQDASLQQTGLYNIYGVLSEAAEIEYLTTEAGLSLDDLLEGLREQRAQYHVDRRRSG